ncbi:MurR/RpiR family transcriptional regulator [Paracoccus laeviglucosivorans]|uniref:Transcriptional regulator, RpiR family n=1 Tax=Paracoccus laeviglucosivorans TaxID=1197861 RepID=A0A521ETA2_9RHOB|nr:MurR/RpiR family transcriptional regulator [Paracoccus laeviglucosivorans]SMO87122.1 transcriptional regulator, RpiR family [Paracoccus laeviglucosivorans]
MQHGELTERIRRVIGELPPTMRRVAQFMDRNPVEVVALSAAELAEALGTSDATIVRTAKALGYSGLSELKRSLTRELSQGTPVDNFQRTLQISDADALRAGLQSIKSTNEILHGLASGASAQVLERMICRLDSGQRIALFGLGPSAHVVQYGAHQLRRQGRAALLLDATGRDLADRMLQLAPGDVLLMLSYSVPNGEAWAVVDEALMHSIPILLITNSQDNPLIRKVDEAIALPRGGARGMALNGASFAFLEALLVGLSVRAPARTDAGLAKLERYRTNIDRLG